MVMRMSILVTICCFRSGMLCCASRIFVALLAICLPLIAYSGLCLIDSTKPALFTPDCHLNALPVFLFAIHCIS